VAVTVFANRAFDAADPYNSRVANSTPTDRQYDLLLWADNNDIDGTALTATPLAAGAAATITASIGSDGTTKVGDGNAPSKDVDWYVVTAPQDGLLQLHTTGTGSFSPSLSLWDFDPQTNLISEIDQETQKDATLGYPVVKDQKVYVAVTG